ncbi:response regulator [Geotalea sp. SG265]|uniref:response regulator n=1 Tax=Geotalea sp. SG265 TaxID=2922867 RepID=UPI001FB0175F|nr:response regulator [Geotalea sp. SG265]
MKTKTVLVVDDSEIVVAMASDALEEGGFKVITAPNAKAADKHIFSQSKPDLIILDVMLPILDGDKKARMLKDNPQTRDIPILLLSSKPADELARLVTDSGADGFIRKPFMPRNMVDKVRDMLS